MKKIKQQFQTIKKEVRLFLAYTFKEKKKGIYLEWNGFKWSSDDKDKY